MWARVWQKDGVALRLLALLETHEVTRVVQVDRQCRACVARALRRFREGSAKVSLARWCQRHVALEFASCYQELERRQIARSAVMDPRVPPRVVSEWAERGHVQGSWVTLRPAWMDTLVVQGSGVMLGFAAAQQASQPMLINVVHTQRRIYTEVMLKITGMQRQDGSGDREEMVLRRVVYLKEYGEWRPPLTTPAKRAYDTHGASCRFDLVSLDGSVTLELAVPAHVDSLMDYYLVKRAIVVVPMDELLYPFVQGIRPMAMLPAAGYPRHDGVAMITFTRLNGKKISSYRLQGRLTIEQQQQQLLPQQQSTSASVTTDAQVQLQDQPEEQRQRRQYTGIERFEILTFEATLSLAPIIPLPLEPGYLWLKLLPNETTNTEQQQQRQRRLWRRRYYSAVMLHDGAQRQGAAMLIIDAQWLPGVLESVAPPHRRHRQALKGFLHLTTHRKTHALQACSIVAQNLSESRLRPYAAHLHSYTRPRSVSS